MIAKSSETISCSEQVREVCSSVRELLDSSPKLGANGRSRLLIGEKDLSSLLSKVERLYSSTRNIEYAFSFVRDMKPSPIQHKEETLSGKISIDADSIATVQGWQSSADRYSNTLRSRRPVITLTRAFDAGDDLRVGAADPAAYRIAYRLLKQGEPVERVAKKLFLPLEEVNQLEFIMNDRMRSEAETNADSSCEITLQTRLWQPPKIVIHREQVLL